MRGGVVHALVVGEHHGDQARVGRALHIVLATQWVQARAGFANLAGNADQGNQTARVIGAVHMLANAHAPQNHRAFGLGKCTRHFAQGLRRDATNGRHGFGAVAFHVVAQRFVVAGAVSNKGFVDQAFFDHGVDQRIEHGHVGIGLELQGAPGVLADVGNTWVSQHNFGAAPSGVFHPGGGHGMVGRGVGTDDKNQVSVLHIIDLVAHRARAHAF